MAGFGPFKILLIAPSSERFYVPSASLGLAYLAASLPVGAEADGLDLNVLKWVHGLSSSGLEGTIDNYFRKAQSYRALPDLIGIAVYQETLTEAVRIAGLAHKYGIPVVTGGIFPTMFPREMPAIFDLLVLGDGRVPFRRIVETLMQYPEKFPADILPTIPGVMARTRSGEWLGGESSKSLTGGEETYPLRAIFDGFNMGFRYYSARVVSSGGCPFACKFCANSEFAKREWHPRPVSRVLEEIEELLRDPSISEISFSDDQFLGFTPAHYRRALQLLQGIETLTRKRNLRINLQVRADHFMEALATEEEMAGVLTSINRNFTDHYAETSRTIHGRAVRGLALDIGVESFLDRRLQAMNKGIQACRNIEAVRMAKHLGLDLGVYMLTFTPDISWEELREEYAIFLSEVIGVGEFSKAAFFNFFQELVPYKGTAFYRELKMSRNLVEEGSFTGFRFVDPRVAAFYLIYLQSLRHGVLGTASSKESIYREVDRLFSLSSKVDKHPSAVEIAEEVICEIKDDKLLKTLCERLIRTLG